MKIYLAGPITGVPYSVAVRWRLDARRYFMENYEVECFDPLRFDKYDTSDDLGYGHRDPSFAEMRTIPHRNLFDIEHSDLILVNFMVHGPRVSFGTVAEIAWAFLLRKPTVVVMEDGNIHDSVYVREISTYVVDSLDRGFKAATVALNLSY